MVVVPLVNCDVAVTTCLKRAALRTRTPVVRFPRLPGTTRKRAIPPYNSGMLLETDKAQRLRLFGEDSCELVSTIEQSFGVKFSEDELVQATTIGRLAHIVFVKLEHPVSPQCLSAVMFYKLRRAFIELFDIPRTQIVLTKPLHELMPWTARKKQWRIIQNHMNYVLPQLTWPVWLLALWLFLAGATLYVILGSKMLRTFGVGVIGVVSVLVLMPIILNPLGREFPRNCKTFGDLVKLALARNYGKMAATHGMTSEKKVVQSLLLLVAAETATDIEKLSPDTLFPEGLKIY